MMFIKLLYDELFSVIIIVITLWMIKLYIQRRRRVNLINKIPGPPSSLLLDYSAIFSKFSPTESFRSLVNNVMLYGHKSKGVTRLWFGPFPTVFLSSPEAAEPLVTSTVELKKGKAYSFVKCWLGEGLVTSEGAKWFSRRKLLTPSFHFSILESFLDIMNEQCDVLIQELHALSTQPSINIQQLVKMCALDIICESAMGCSVNAQKDSNSEYVKAMDRFVRVLPVLREKFWLRIKFIFKFTKYYKIQQQSLAIMKNFTRTVIQERKKTMTNEDIFPTEDMYGKKKKLAFLDLVLLTRTKDGKPVLTDEEVQEEVDTFMFAGHDTVTAGVSWCLFLLGHYSDIQEKCYEELHELFGDSDRHATLNDLREMKYLECCIKESQRMYPSVPIFSRTLTRDTVICGYLIPKGTTCGVSTYALHRHPDFWSDPERFNPDRFKAENIVGMHPYAFLPFSAGPRNCIGQKFAINEEKVMLSTILRNFKVKSLDRLDQVKPMCLMILTKENGFNVQLTPRTTP